MRPLAILLLALLSAAEDADALIARADALDLASDPYWAVLLHAPAGESQIDDPAFFLAPQGKTDLHAELQATIRALLNPQPAQGRHAFERFPARCEWLVGRLGLDRSRLPVSGNADLERQIASLGQGSLTLVFPAALIGSPASMFGHTLLLVRPAGIQGMAGTAVTYAAVAPGDDPLTYAVKGLGGGYPGYLSTLPYWQKLSEYRDIDQRDLWEYELDYTPEEIRRVLLHVWELRGIRADYWFFTENCAYYLLWLLDAGRPEADLHEMPRWWKWWVIPIDTVRYIRESGMVVRVARRPSLATSVRTQAERLGPERTAAARRITIEGVSPQAPQSDAEVLDLAALWLQARRNRQELSQGAYQQRLMPLLAARSRLGAAAPAQSAREEARSPDQGHGSMRASLGGGQSGDAGYVELGLRFAYHDVLDPEWGRLADRVRQRGAARL